MRPLALLPWFNRECALGPDLLKSSHYVRGARRGTHLSSDQGGCARAHGRSDIYCGHVPAHPGQRLFLDVRAGSGERKEGCSRAEAEEGDRKARAALDLGSNSEQFLATIQVAITLVGFASSAFASTSLSDPLGGWFMSLGMPAGIAVPLAPVLITLAVSYLSIVVGELVPKRIALSDAERTAKSVAGPIRGFMTIARPLVWLTAKSANGLSALLGIKSADERDSVSEEEIKYMVADADELSDQEKSMIHEVIELGDTIAREVMVPRVDMTAVEDTMTLSEVLAIMRRTGYSRIPVYHESVDRIVGIAHIKDIISPILDEGRADDPIARHARTADFIPDTKDIIPLLSRCSPATTRWSSSSTSTAAPPASSRSRTSSRRSSARSRTSSTPTTSTSRSSPSASGSWTAASPSTTPSSSAGPSRTPRSSRPSPASSWTRRTSFRIR